MTVVDGATIAGERIVRADVAIVGSGAGGAPVAALLAEAGARVVVVEEGPHVTTDQFTARPRDMLALLYRDAGQFATLGSPPIPLPLGCAVGGTTLVNSGTCFRAPDDVVEGWGLDELTPESLAPHYATVESDLRVAPVDPALAGNNAHVARRGAEALGWSGGWLQRNATGCRGSGVCAYGCPRAAKRHTGLTYMPRAWEAGATTFTRTRATRVTTERRRATGIEARTAGGGRLTVHADRVVISAGSVHTPLLLARSAIANASGQLGRNLSIHPATAVWALMDETVDMHRGVPQSYYVDEFASEGIMLEGVAGPPDHLALAMPFAGARHRELMLAYPRVAQFGVMVTDRTRGRVLVGRAARASGRAIVRYDLERQDVARLHQGVIRLAELFRAAGAIRSFTPVGRVRELPGSDPAPLRRLDVRARELKLMAFHPLGTARAHGDPARGVVDGDLAVHGTAGLYVADGSVVPSALGVNPQMTIMALAVRLGRHLER